VTRVAATRVIDTHSHYIPAEVVRDARRGTAVDGVSTETRDGVEWLVHRQGFRYPVPTSFHDLEARLQFMDEQGTDQAVISISPTLYCYWVDAAEAIEFSAMANESMARSAAESGGRLVAAATLPMQDPDAAVKELHRAVRELGMCAVEFAPSIQGVLVDDPALRPVLAAVNELRVPVLMHSSPFEPRPENLREFYLNNLIGNPLATTVGAARLIFSGILDELPDLTVVLVHGGGYLPYQIGRFDHGHQVRSETKGCALTPSAYLPRFVYDTITHAPAPLRFLVDFVGADHVVYGTDFAYDMGGGSFAEQVEGAGLDAGELEQVGWRTAADLFGIAPATD
jgi:aminocarboxymuconate-semialdehyde decarboxylase